MSPDPQGVCVSLSCDYHTKGAWLYFLPCMGCACSECKCWVFGSPLNEVHDRRKPVSLASAYRVSLRVPGSEKILPALGCKQEVVVWAVPCLEEVALHFFILSGDP